MPRLKGRRAVSGLAAGVRLDLIVRHALGNVKAILRTAGKMKFIVEDPAEELLIRHADRKEAQNRAPNDPRIVDDIPYPRVRELLAVAGVT